MSPDRDIWRHCRTLSCRVGPPWALTDPEDEERQEEETRGVEGMDDPSDSQLEPWDERGVVLEIQGFVVVLKINLITV